MSATRPEHLRMSLTDLVAGALAGDVVRVVRNDASLEEWQRSFRVVVAEARRQRVRFTVGSRTTNQRGMGKSFETARVTCGLVILAGGKRGAQT